MELPTTRPVKPDNADPAFRVNTELPSLMVSVPLPDKIPLRVMLAALVLMVGLAPSGRLHSLLIVLTPEWANTTRLKVALLQDKVALPPSKVTVPLLWLKVVPALSVKVEAAVMLPLGALKTLVLFKLKAPLKSAPLGAVTVAVFCMVK